jgi:hypothetical protein
MKVDLPVASCVRLDSVSQLEVNSPQQSDVTSTPTTTPSSHNRDVLFAKELCDLLGTVEVAIPGSTVEVAIPGCGRAIACLLTGTTIKSNKKMGDCSRTDIPKKSLRCKDKKSSVTRKTSAAA